MTLAPLLTAGPAIQLRTIAANGGLRAGNRSVCRAEGDDPGVIPGRAEGATRNREHRVSLWIPGPPLRGVPE